MKKILIVLGAIFVVVIVIAIASSSGNGTPQTTTAAPNEDTTNANQSYKYGQASQIEDLTLTVQKPRKTTQQYIGTQYCTTITYKNTGNTQQSFNPFDWKFRTSDGVEISASVGFNSKKPLNSGELRPGGTVKGDVCTDTQTDDVKEVVYTPGLISEPVVFTN